MLAMTSIRIMGMAPGLKLSLSTPLANLEVVKIFLAQTDPELTRGISLPPSLPTGLRHRLHWNAALIWASPILSSRGNPLPRRVPDGHW